MWLDLPLHSSLLLTPLDWLEKWGIDYVSPFAPMSSKRNQYIIVATKYLTKWIEAKTVKNVDVKQTAIFLYKNIISCFGSPKILVSDQGSHFLNETIEFMTIIFQINHQKTNGHTERVNQTLVRIIRKTISDNKRD